MLPTVRRSFVNPFAELQREIDRVFDHAWQQNEANGHGNGGGGLTANYPVDIREHDHTVTVEAELPGFKRDDINVTLEQGVLTITAERKPEEQPGHAHIHERRYTRVTRSFRLGAAVDETKVEARLEDGVLKLTLPKREELKPRKIEVK